MKENFQIHIWLGLLLCLLGMSCSDDTPAKGDDPGNGNTELEVNEWIESVQQRNYLWNNDIPAQNKLDKVTPYFPIDELTQVLLRQFEQMKLDNRLHNKG